MKLLLGVVWLPIRLIIMMCGGRQVPILKGLVEKIDSTLR